MKENITMETSDEEEQNSASETSPSLSVNETNEDDEFQQLLREVAGILALLSCPKAFFHEYGFTMYQYLSERRMCAYCLRKTASRIQGTVKKAGMARTTGGLFGIASGGLMISGLIAAPFTAGVSLGLTISGVVTGVGGAATNVTAAAVKDFCVESDLAEIKIFQDKIQTKDEKVICLFQDLTSKSQRMNELVINEDRINSANINKSDFTKIVGCSIAHKGYVIYTSANAIKFAAAMADIIRADMMAAQGVASSMAAPGINAFGTTVVAAGTQTAKLFGGILSGVGILFGAMDIYKGARDINGSEKAFDLLKAAMDMDKVTNQCFDIVSKLELALQ